MEVCFDKIKIFEVLFVKFFFRQVIDGSLSVIVFFMFREGPDKIYDGKVARIWILAFSIYILKRLYRISPIKTIHPRLSDHYVCIVHPFAVGVTLDRDWRHLDCFCRFFFISLCHGGVEGRKQAEYPVIIINVGLLNRTFNFRYLIQGVIVSIVMSCQVVVRFTRPRVLFIGATVE